MCITAQLWQPAENAVGCHWQIPTCVRRDWRWIGENTDGLGMLVNQGVIGIRHWTGLDADPALMRQALLDLRL